MQSSYALRDNHDMLKSINMNKMQHQYIQNLQRANMTLKCKIKEMSEALREADGSATEPAAFTEAAADRGRLGRDREISEDEKEVDSEATESSEELDEDQLELKAIGTIEEVTRARKQERRNKSKIKSRATHHSKHRGMDATS